MSLVNIGLYIIVAQVIMPQTYKEVPFMQMGLGLWNVLERAVEIGLYEMAAFEFFKFVACWFKPDWALEQ